MAPYFPDGPPCGIIQAMRLTLPVNNLTQKLPSKMRPLSLSQQIFGGLYRYSAVATCLLLGAIHGETAQARESFTSAPSAQLVETFFDDITGIIFLTPAPVTDNSSASDKPAEIRRVLAQSIDAAGISRFILGRYVKDQNPAGVAADAPAGSNQSSPRISAEDGFLDFATSSVLRLTPHKTTADASGQTHPTLAVFAMTMRADQTRLVQSELVLVDGRRIPLTWEIAARPAGLRIEDVTCLGISLRLMLRSAVAEAAAEHPEAAHDLSALLQADHAFSQFAPSLGTPQ